MKGARSPSPRSQDDLPNPRRPHINARQITLANHIRRILNAPVRLVFCVAHPEADSVLDEHGGVEYRHAVPACEDLERSQGLEAVLVGRVVF